MRHYLLEEVNDGRQEARVHTHGALEHRPLEYVDRDLSLAPLEINKGILFSNGVKKLNICLHQVLM